MRWKGLIVALGLLLVVSAEAKKPRVAPERPDVVTDYAGAKNGLRAADTKAGKGKVAVDGHVVTVEYTGWIAGPNGEALDKFDSSYDRPESFRFRLGAGEVIPGWDQGVRGMRIGGKRQLVIPPELAYGDQDLGAIPPHSTLIFDVVLLDSSAERWPPVMPTQVPEEAYQQLPSGLQYADVVVGTGKTPSGLQSKVTVEYTGWLTDGSVFDSSYRRKKPISFPLDAVIKGWTEGVSTMKVGGKRILLIPPELGYGSQGAGGIIPPDSPLIFEIELLSTD